MYSHPLPCQALVPDLVTRLTVLPALLPYWADMFNANCWNSSTESSNRRVDHAAAQALVRYAVDEEAVEVFAQAVDDRVVAVFKVDAHHVHRAGAQLHQVEHVAAVQRQVVDLRRTHGGRQLGIFGVHVGRCAGDFDDFRSLADLQLEVDVRDGAGVDARHRCWTTVLKPEASTVIL